MKIKVGSKNPTKIDATRNILTKNKLFADAQVIGADIDIEEFGHPKSLKETIEGARNRAKAAFTDCALSVGIESGLMQAPGTKSGYLEITICALYDGKVFHIGASPSFEWPINMVSKILSGLDGSQAFKEIGLTEHEKVGVAEGGIHVLTHGKINRTKINELAVMMALIHLENPNHY